MEIKDLISFRKHLHKNAELSGKEEKTASIIIEKLKEFEPDELITNIGGFGIAAIFKGKEKGQSVLLRCDMDALPIPESNDFDYLSQNPEISHKCGHDGHMTIMIGVASSISKIKDDLKGEVILLFQPAEEIAHGAKAILEDEKWNKVKPDYVFALHNLPGFETGSVILRRGIFSSASKGLIATFKGETSHAAHPENGRSPLLAMLALIQGLIAIPGQYTKFSNSALITIIHARLGEIAFGTSPGVGEVMATLRSHFNEDMDTMTGEAFKLVAYQSDAYELESHIELVEEFPATNNDDECFDIVRESAKNLTMNILYPDNPFPWSEDFGYLTEQYKGALFGLGSGREHPQLHNSNYDFPNGIIIDGVNIFTEIVKRVLK